MAIRCNICALEIDEKELEGHLDTPQHKENKSKISKTSEQGSDASVVKTWYRSFNNN
ncbi:MAG: hypothetical protein ACREBB_07210 [Nitrosotalea sp.]